MKIQKPLKALPSTLVRNTTRTSKYKPIYDTLTANLGLWVPTTFSSPEDAKLAQVSVYQYFRKDKQHMISTALDREKCTMYCKLELRKPDSRSLTQAERIKRIEAEKLATRAARKDKARA